MSFTKNKFGAGYLATTF